MLLSAPFLTISITKLFKRRGLSSGSFSKQPFLTGSCLPFLISNRKQFTEALSFIVFAMNTMNRSIPVKIEKKIIGLLKNYYLSTYASKFCNLFFGLHCKDHLKSQKNFFGRNLVTLFFFWDIQLYWMCK